VFLILQVPYALVLAAIATISANLQNPAIFIH
jgi:hypothetical protein